MQMGMPGQDMGMMQQGMMQQGMMQPMQPGMMQQGMMQPGMMQQQPGMGMMQPGMDMQGQGMVNWGQVQGMGNFGMPMVDGWTVLQNIAEIEIQEKIQWGELLSELLIGVEIDFANQYKGIDPRNNQDLFYFAEQTDFCTRQMKRGCCADCVGWNLDVMNIAGGQKTKFMHAHRDHSCVFLCLNRPKLEITDAATGQTIGFLIDPFACCDLTFKLLGPDEEEVLQGRGGCCQWGLCCPLPCGPCATVTFDVVDSASGSSVGEIEKQVPSCCKFCLDADVSNYHVKFGEVQNPQWKAMVMLLAIFIDFRYFSETQDPSDAMDSGGGLLGAVLS